MGYLGTGLLQGASQGFAYNEQRKVQKEQLELAKKRFDLEEKEKEFSIEQLKKRLQALSGFMSSVNQPPGGEAAPAPQGPGQNLNLGAPGLQTTLPQASPASEPNDLRSLMTRTGNPNEDMIKRLNMLQASGVDTAPIISLLQKTGQLKLPSDKPPSVGSDREAISLELYDKEFSQLTTSERTAVNQRVRQESDKHVETLMSNITRDADELGLKGQARTDYIIRKQAEAGGAKAGAVSEATPVSESAATAIVSAKNLIKQAETLQANYDPSFVGKIEGTIFGSIKEKTGKISEKEQTFRTTAKDMADQLARMRSGAAISIPEYNRLISLLPSPGDSEAQFAAKLERFKNEMQNIVNERTNLARTPKGQLENSTDAPPVIKKIRRID